MPQKSFTQEQIDFIDQCYREHPSAKSITQKYRDRFGIIASATITKFLKNRGYHTFTRGKKPPIHDDVKRRWMSMKFGDDESCKIDLAKYPDWERLSLLSRRFSHYKWKWSLQFTRLEFFDYFYFDAQFNTVFDTWKRHDKHALLTPSFDHIVPTSRGGLSTLQNLQCLSIWENRAKYNLTQDEWIAFKQMIITQ